MTFNPLISPENELSRNTIYDLRLHLRRPSHGPVRYQMTRLEFDMARTISGGLRHWGQRSRRVVMAGDALGTGLHVTWAPQDGSGSKSALQRCIAMSSPMIGTKESVWHKQSLLVFVHVVYIQIRSNDGKSALLSGKKAGYGWRRIVDAHDSGLLDPCYCWPYKSHSY